MANFHRTYGCYQASYRIDVAQEMLFRVQNSSNWDVVPPGRIAVILLMGGWPPQSTLG